MSISISGSMAAAIRAPHSQQPAPAPKSSPQTSAQYPQDTITLSSTALKASPGGDVDHDGDSR